MDLQITAFPARNGESLLIECYGKEKTNILVADCRQNSHF